MPDTTTGPPVTETNGHDTFMEAHSFFCWGDDEASFGRFAHLSNKSVRKLSLIFTRDLLSRLHFIPSLWFLTLIPGYINLLSSSCPLSTISRFPLRHCFTRP